MTERLEKSYEPRRNAPCWCGSGKKYKKCHMNRSDRESVPLSQILETERKAFGQKMCLHPSAGRGECEGAIVKAHTIQRAGLSTIAEDGHVYAPEPDASALRLDSTKAKALVFRKVGLNKASTFTGFCAKHDNETFRPIEGTPFTPCPEHAFLLGYRALCRELFAKKAALRMSETYRTIDSGHPLPGQIAIQGFVDPFLKGTQAGHDDLCNIKRAYDTVLQSGDFLHIRYYTVFFDRCPDVLSAGGFWPEYDFTGRKVQNPLTPNAEGMQFSLIPTESGGAAVFTWLERDGVAEEFIESFHAISDSSLPHAILRFTFEYFENTYLRPSWWESLPAQVAAKLHHRMAMLDSVFVEHQPDCLCDDGLEIATWQAVERLTNSQCLRMRPIRDS